MITGPLLGKCSKELKSTSQGGTSTVTFISTLFIYGFNTNCPLTDEWVKNCSIYVQCNYSALEGKEILLFVKRWLDLNDIMLSETIQSQKDKYCMIPLIWGM